MHVDRMEAPNLRRPIVPWAKRKDDRLAILSSKNAARASLGVHADRFLRLKRVLFGFGACGFVALAAELHEGDSLSV